MNKTSFYFCRQLKSTGPRQPCLYCGSKLTKLHCDFDDPNEEPKWVCRKCHRGLHIALEHLRTQTELEKMAIFKTYTIAPDGKSITCLRCKKTSHNLNDVSNLYCNHCHVYHDDIWPPARKWWISSLEEGVPK